MEIIDINCMLGSWPSKIRNVFTPENLIEEMDKYRISSCLAYHSTSLWSPKRGNKLICEISQGSQGRIKPCFIIEPELENPFMPDYNGLIKQLLLEKPAAVRLYPNLKNFCLDEFYCGELLEILSNFNIPIILEADQTPSYDRLPELLRNWPDIKFILLRHGLREARFILPLIKKTDNIYFDTSIMIDTGLIEEIVNKYGSEKLLFSSGLPFFVPTGALSLIIYSRIQSKHKDNILSGNWLRIEGEQYENIG